MKILCTEYNSAGEVAIVPIGDDALLRNNGDFYIPEFTEGISCVPQFVVRICKLGKSVSERFAFRYYDEIGIGLRFYADSLEKELIGKGLPAIVASSFDCSAAISPLERMTDRNVSYRLFVNAEEVCRENLPDLPWGIDHLIVQASDFHMLKIGDLLYCGSKFRYRGLKRRDRILMLLGEKELMNFEIK